MNLSRQVPKYEELADSLREELGQYQAGDYLPSETRLAQRFAVNRHTLRRAVDVLVSEGRVLRHQGRGVRVLELPIVYPVHAASAYSKTLSAMGYRSQAMLLARRERAAQVSEAKDLQLAPGERVLEIQTLRLLNEQPISLITHCFSARHRRLLDGYEGGSVRQHLARKEISLKRTSTLIGAHAPSQQEALQLLMPRRIPVLSIWTISSDQRNNAFELSRSITRADRFTYQILSGEQHEHRS